MIKTIDLMTKVFRETDKQLLELEKQKDTMSKGTYKKLMKLILKQSKKQIKQIEKRYPIKKEVEKYLQEN